MKVTFQHLRYLRVGLRSKELFCNFGASLMYLLYRLGLINNRAVKVILEDGCVAFAELDRFDRVINAYYDGLISGIHCLGNDFYVDFMGLRFRDVFRSMVEVFVEGRWSFLDVRGRQVVDVGAFNGDSAIYFRNY